MLAPVRTVAPADTPVSLAELKQHVRRTLGDETYTDEDTVLQIYLDAAVQHVDGYTGVLGRALMPQTWTQDFCGFDDLCLSISPVTAVAVTYYDTDNAQQTLSSSVYSLLVGQLGPRIVLNWGQVWPNVYGREDAVRVTMTAGYADAAAVPASIKIAILLLAAHWYENREAVGDNTQMALPFAVDALLSPLRRVAV